MTDQHLQLLTQRVAILEKKTGNNTIDMSQCITIEPTCINTRRDIVARGHIVASMCEPNRLVSTNEHKQLQSINLSEIIKGVPSQINIETTANGITLSTPQDISTYSTPLFKSIYVTDTPQFENNVVTKSYVDNAILNCSKHELNLCTRVDIVNPEGSCIRMGRDKGTFIDINVDANGTLNLTNTDDTTETNDIDIYCERINLLSNINATSPQTGSLVLYGGAGIIKDLYIGGGIYLCTNNGVPTKLDFFEEGSLQINWTGIWSTVIESEFMYQRIGKCITLMIPYIGSQTSTSDIITNTSDTYLPLRLRPVYDIESRVTILDNNIQMTGLVTIYGTDGRVTVKPEINPKFTGTGISGFHTFSMVYFVGGKVS